MDGSEDFGGILPRGRLAVLLEAALGPGEAAPAWRRYLEALGGAAPNDGERRVYPMVAARLDMGALDREARRPLAAARRSAAAMTMVLSATAARLEAAARARGIEVIFVKGMALMARCYRDEALRLFHDVDFYTAEADLDGVLALADAQGWRSGALDPEHDPARLRCGNGVGYTLPGGLQVDYRCRLRPPFAFDPGLDAEFRASARRVAWQGRDWLVPSDLWLLIETLDHGLKRNEVAPIRWVADAHRLLSMPDLEIDWDAFLDIARRAGMGEIFRTGLEAAAAVGAPLPGAVLAALEAGRPSRMQRRELRLRLTQGGSGSPVLRLREEFLHYCLRAPGRMPLKTLGFPAHLRGTMVGCETWMEFWPVAARAFLRRVGRR